MAIYYFCVFEYFSKSRYFITLKEVVYLFTMLFLSIVPFFQYVLDIQIWSQARYKDISHIKANLLIILFLLSYKACYSSFRVKFKKESPIEIGGLGFVRMSILLLSVVIILIFSYGDLGIIFEGRNQFETARLNKNNTIHNLIEMASRTTIFFSVVLNLKYYKLFGNLSSKIFLFINLTIMLVLVSPFVIPRYLTITFYLPILLILFNPYKVREWSKVAFILIVLVLFPLFGALRKGFGYWDTNILKTILETGSFDSYEMLVLGVEHYSTADFSNGFQLLGSILFFVPRILWADKPIGTGETLAIEQGFPFTNVSFPFVAEGYGNFGIIGVVLFAGAMAFVHKRFDRIFWAKNKFDYTVGSVFYLCLIGLTFFIMRGDFLSSYAYTISIFLILITLKAANRFNSDRLLGK